MKRDGTGSRTCPTSASICGAIRVNLTCADKSGHDARRGMPFSNSAHPRERGDPGRHARQCNLFWTPAFAGVSGVFVSGYAIIMSAHGGTMSAHGGAVKSQAMTAEEPCALSTSAHSRASGNPEAICKIAVVALDHRFPPSRSALRRTRTRRSSQRERRLGRGGERSFWFRVSA